jgi:hypothetical protein
MNLLDYQEVNMAKTGRVEVAEAVAAISGQVTVTLLGGGSFVTSPIDLFAKTFNDPQVGIDDTRMTDFKGTLQGLLAGEGIDDAINKIPNNSNIVIDQVANIISLALAL